MNNLVYTEGKDYLTADCLTVVKIIKISSTKIKGMIISSSHIRFRNNIGVIYYWNIDGTFKINNKISSLERKLIKEWNGSINLPSNTIETKKEENYKYHIEEGLIFMTDKFNFKILSIVDNKLMVQIIDDEYNKLEIKSQTFEMNTIAFNMDVIRPYGDVKSHLDKDHPMSLWNDKYSIEDWS